MRSLDPTEPPDGDAVRPVEVRRGVRVPTTDPAVTLAADVYLPASHSPAPALITVLPYRRDLGAGIGGDSLLRWFAERGYACVLVDFRGTGGSDGEMRRPFDPAEADDGIAAVEWAATQPWCTGQVGMWGHSYGAVMTMRVAARQPAPLTAILPVMGMTDPERDFVHPAGLRGAMASLGIWGTQNLLNQIIPPLEDKLEAERGAEHETSEQRARWHRRLTQRPWLLHLVDTGPADSWWRASAIDPSQIIVPTFAVAGWRDLFCAATIRSYEQIPAPKKLLAGPWMHTMPDASPFAAIDFPALALRWWDHWLRGVDTGFMDEAPITAYLQGPSPRWVRSAGWADAPTASYEAGVADGTDGAMALINPNRLHGSSQILSNSDGAESAAASQGIALTIDATVGPLSGLGHIPTSGVGLPLDQHDDDQRSLTLTTEPLSEALDILGHAQLTVDHDLAPRRLIARLTDVSPDARSTLITDAVTAIEPGSTTTTLQFDPTGYHLAAGHRLRLTLSTADFPRLWPASGDESAINAAATICRVTVHMPLIADGESANTVDIPAAPPVDSDNTLIAGGQSTWSITRDVIADAVTVIVGDRFRATTANRSHEVDIEHRAYAHVANQQPDDATIHATCHATITPAPATPGNPAGGGGSAAGAVAPTGPPATVTAHVEVHLASDNVVATARITRGSEELFTARWP